MSSPHLSLDLPSLEQVIDRSPITISADALMSDVVTRMSQPPGSHCCLLDPDAHHHSDLHRTKHSSCVLVMAESELVGILTERDIVRLVASGVELFGVKVAEVMTHPVITLTLSEAQTALTASTLLRAHQVRHLPILDAQGQLLGLVTPSLIRQALQPMYLLRQYRIAEVMTTEVIHAPRSASVLEIAQLMAESRVSCVVITETDGEQADPVADDGCLTPLGIITERDIVQFRALALNFGQIQAETVMSAPLFCLHPSDSLWVAHQRMQAQYVQRLVVAGDRGELLGIVTQTNLLQVLNPLEIATIVETLHDQIDARTLELQQANQRLQQEVAERQRIQLALQDQQQQLQKGNRQLKQRVVAQTEEAETAKNQINIILESITDGFIALDRDWHFTYVNPRAGQILQQDPVDLLGKNVWSEFANVTDTAFYREYHRCVSEQVTVEFEEFYAPLETWFGVHAYPSAEGLVAYFKDITARKQAELKVREQAVLLDIASDAIAVRDLEHHILYWNQGAERLYGWTTAEAMGQNANQLLNQPSAVSAQAKQVVITTGEWQGELQLTTKSGRAITVDSRWTLVRDNMGNPKFILVVNTDITEKKQLEAQFLRAQRLESIGTLSSGIAHDLNNILAPILIGAQLLQQQFPEGRQQELLKILEANARRGSDLVQQVLTFAKGTEGQRGPLQLKHLLYEVQQICEHTFPKSITTRLELPSTLAVVSADSTQLHQVLMNLCVNARDAMPNGGILTMSATDFWVDESYARLHLEASVGAYVVITLEDTGMGMTPEVLERIFDPFFTTKSVEQGTGLGLSVVQGIIRSHAGFITVESKLGQGSQFQLFLPTIADAVKSTVADLNYTSGQGELILVVDDEANILEVTKKVLEDNNYRVLTANSGLEAIACLAQHQDQIAAVLMDMMMPELSGQVAIQVLRRINPNLAIIASSGLPLNLLATAADDPDIQASLPKPYTAQDLLATLAQVLRAQNS
jgi:PAS domain S-box-containing protein